MENENFLQPTRQLEITASSIGFLAETRKWASFLSIVGFIMLAIIVMISLFIGSIFTALSATAGIDMPVPGGLITVFYLIIAGIIFFPTYYMYQFSSKMKQALNTNDAANLEEAFKNHKSMYKFWGIYTIITLVLYFLIFIGSMAMGVMGAMAL